MKYSKGPWTSTFNTKKERGVRNINGFICFLPKPSHYPGQDERYENELEENKADANLIAHAPDMFEALLSANNYFVDLQNKCALTNSDERAWKLISKIIKEVTE